MSFYTSLTGLNAAAAELSVASNNIANSSTTSFKRSNVSFGDIFASSASSNTATAMGGGVALIGVNQEFSQGGLELSDNAPYLFLDCTSQMSLFLEVPIARVGSIRSFTSHSRDLLTKHILIDLDNHVTWIFTKGIVKGVDVAHVLSHVRTIFIIY